MMIPATPHRATSTAKPISAVIKRRSWSKSSGKAKRKRITHMRASGIHSLTPLKFSRIRTRWLRFNPKMERFPTWSCQMIMQRGMLWPRSLAWRSNQTRQNPSSRDRAETKASKDQAIRTLTSSRPSSKWANSLLRTMSSCTPAFITLDQLSMTRTASNPDRRWTTSMMLLHAMARSSESRPVDWTRRLTSKSSRTKRNRRSKAAQTGRVDSSTSSPHSRCCP